MYRIRYYAETIHPDHFKRSGWLGFWVIALNWLRWQLETFVQKLVLKWLVKNGSLPKEKLHSHLRTFHLDVAAEKLEKERTSPELQGVETAGVVVTRADKYVDGSIKSALAEESGKPEPDRPRSINDMIGAYGLNTRAKRYFKGRRFTVVDPEGDFEPLSPVVDHADPGGGR